MLITISPDVFSLKKVSLCRYSQQALNFLSRAHQVGDISQAEKIVRLYKSYILRTD